MFSEIQLYVWECFNAYVLKTLKFMISSLIVKHNNLILVSNNQQAKFQLITFIDYYTYSNRAGGVTNLVKI